MPFPYVFPLAFGGSATTYTPYDTAGNIINDAATELGLTPVSDPYASTDANFIRLRTFLKSLGRRLWRMRPWNQLQKEYTFVTASQQYQYPLPADFGYLINQTGWDRTNRLPLGGPLSPQEWQYLKARLVGVTFTLLVRQVREQLDLYPDTAIPAGRTIAYEYVSRYWAQTAAATSPDKDAPTAASDIIWFDPELVMYGLKLAWRKSAGLDTTAEQEDWEEAYALVCGDDGPSPVLRIGGSGYAEPLLGGGNVPLTGFGS